MLQCRVMSALRMWNIVNALDCTPSISYQKLASSKSKLLPTVLQCYNVNELLDLIFYSVSYYVSFRSRIRSLTSHMQMTYSTLILCRVQVSWRSYFLVSINSNAKILQRVIKSLWERSKESRLDLSSHSKICKRMREFWLARGAYRAITQVSDRSRDNLHTQLVRI